MPATDIIHDAVKNALSKNGWTITDDPFTISFMELVLFADLGAERPIGAEREGERLVIEIKSFRSQSAMREFEQALGQYLIYRLFLEANDAERMVWLAVDNEVYTRFFRQQAIRRVLQEFEVHLLVIDLETEEIVKWIN